MFALVCLTVTHTVSAWFVAIVVPRLLGDGGS